MRKRILIFSLAYFPQVGGAEVAVKEITDRIPDIEFHMVTLRFADEARTERVGNVVVHRVGVGSGYLSKVFYVPAAYVAARRLHRIERFDAFWAIMSYMLFPIALLRLSGVRVPYVLTLQEGDPFEHVFDRLRIRPFRPLLAYGFRHASAVQAISRFLLAWSVRAGFPGQGQVIPNGVDVAAFSGALSTERRAELRSALGAKPDTVLLVTTSRLVKKNAVDDVIRALPLLPERVQFVVYGIGKDEEMLRALARACGVERRVRFMGQISHAELPAALQTCDIFIRPSRSEGMGNSFIEAMAAGLPVIATQEGGIADFLFDAVRNPDTESTGWAVDKDSPEQIARAVETILSDPAAARATIAHAKELVVHGYGWDAVARGMSRLFTVVLGSA